MDYTQNLHLPQWEETDRIQMDDFNDMTATLDAALAAKSRVACGVYTGNGQSTRTINLGFTPKAVLIVPSLGSFSEYSSPNYYVRGGLAVTGQNVYCKNTSESYLAIKITEGGFTVYNTQTNTNYWSRTNDSNYTYTYIAIE